MFQLPEESRTVGGAEETTFKRWADFSGARFAEHAYFGGARFEQRARFGSVLFRRDATFEGAFFARARTLGPIVVIGRLTLDRAIFEAPLLLRVLASEVSCDRTQFFARASLEVRSARVSFALAEFAQPSIASGAAEEFGAYAACYLKRVKDRAAKPVVTSLRRANVGQLTLADVDLSECRFAGAHNLDGLRFEGGIDFEPTSGRWRARRRTIAEEVIWRKQESSRDLSPDRIARTYRALRKGREDNKDQPGAADFYYGEMEMRRRAVRRKEESGDPTRTSRTEQAILALYWLVSGYGLRASRAVLALMVTVLAFAAGFQAGGFDPDQGFPRSLLFSAESTSSLFRPPELPDKAELTDLGHVLQMGLRLLGPLFFGLALLALRGRVKR
jgi:uncharacterized protein YjbI with pentapeptide repeats